MGLFKKRPPNTNNTYINFVIAQRGGDKKITDLRTRDFYNMLLGQIIKRPAAEYRWTQTFPTLDITSIWEDIGLKHPHLVIVISESDID